MEGKIEISSDGRAWIVVEREGKYRREVELNPGGELKQRVSAAKPGFYKAKLKEVTEGNQVVSKELVDFFDML